ncbi:MAG: CDP-alcohol phosphatidyltransferase family protein [Candidatus Bathyarchaeota archaeon]|nr:CDP-alcohol phosphatidyltransferase family protein [Candidatus Bathyarchaeota archaeon]
MANVARRCGFTPNMMTALGLGFGVASGAALSFGGLLFAFAFGFLSVFCDVLDGTIARKFHLESKEGLVFDSFADRTSELAVVVGALAGGIIEPIGVVAIVGSTALFALRSLSHSRGFKTDYVYFGRAERLTFILLGLIVPASGISSLCFVLAGGFGLFSSAQIAVFLWRQKIHMQPA